jgi:phosphatidylserine decarboxylase
MFAVVQHILPKRLLSRFVGVFAVVRWPLLKNILIRSFIRVYAVDMSTSKRKTPEEFETFADFFSRELIPDLRPIPSDSMTITSPVDGVVSQSGIIQRGNLLQAKGHTYRFFYGVQRLLKTSILKTFSVFAFYKAKFFYPNESK